MKLRFTPHLLLLLLFYFVTIQARPQCTAATPEQCPDPENNGQICPDSLVAAHVGQLYSQVVTIKPPAVYMVDSVEIVLDHAQLMQVGNLPQGITYQSNADNNIFTAGEYYCILLEGTPDSVGSFALHIVVDVYAVIFPGLPAIKVKTVTDSTSLTLVVIDNTGIGEAGNTPFFVRQNVPNPFRAETRIDFHSEISGVMDFTVYSMMGQCIHSEQVNVTKGENALIFDGMILPKGSYIYVFRSAGYKSTGIMIRKD
jgi:hypothetical protein